MLQQLLQPRGRSSKLLLITYLCRRQGEFPPRERWWPNMVNQHNSQQRFSKAEHNSNFAFKVSVLTVSCRLLLFSRRQAYPGAKTKKDYIDPPVSWTRGITLRCTAALGYRIGQNRSRPRTLWYDVRGWARNNNPLLISYFSRRNVTVTGTFTC